MTTLQTILAILPGIFIAVWIFYADRHEKEPFPLVLLCFIMGMGSIFPAIVLEEIGMALGIQEGLNLFETFVMAFGVVGISEELVKFATVMLFAYPWKPFNEPMDGIVYSVMVAMGFATLENILYSNLYGMETVILRAFTAVPAHASFGIFMGYHIGLAKFDPENRNKHLFLGFSGAVVFHGAYDFFLLQQSFPLLAVFAFVTLIICIFYTRQLIRLHSEDSPFKEDELAEEMDSLPSQASETNAKDWMN